MSADKKTTLAPTIISQEAVRLLTEESFKARVVTSKDLLGESKSLVIQHEGETYHLRATKFGKLVLTK